MKIRFLVLGILLMGAAQAFAQGDAKAVEIVKKARAVIGKEDKIKAMQNVVAEGTFKQSMGQRNLEGPLEITMALPDKIYRSVTRSMGPMEMTTIEVLNGNTTWTDFTSSQPLPGGPGGGMMRGMGGGGFLSPEQQERNRRNDLSRVMLGWFLLAPSGLNAEYTYVGEAKAPDGTADVIGVKTADGLIAKLYIDQQSKQLLMLSYKDKDMSALFRGGQGGAGGRAPGQAQAGQGGGQGQGGQGGQGGQRGPNGMSREEFDKLPQAEKDKIQAEQRVRNEARMVEMKANYEKAPEVDYQWSFSDYKEVNGLKLPHILTKAVGGNPTEEWVISKFKFNEKKVTAEKFEKKGK